MAGQLHPPVSLESSPRERSKYRPVWQRLRVKVKTKLFFERLGREIHLYGANTLGGTDTDNDGLVIRKLQEAGHISESPTQQKTYLCIPGSTVKTIWSSIYLILMFYTAFVMPYKLAFLQEDRESADFWLDASIDGLFFIDILVRLNSAYIDSMGNMVTNRKAIVLKYAKTWLCIDFLACFPFYLLEEGQSDTLQQSSSKYKVFLRLARIPRLYRLLRITRVFRFAKHYREYDCLERLQSHITPSSIRLVAFGLSVILGVHLMTCAWYFTARIEGFGPETWVNSSGLLDKSPGDLYAASMYWTITTLATIGYGDIVPGSSVERVMAIIWMLVGVSFYSFMISSLANLLHNIDSKETVLSNKLIAIDEFAEEAKLDKHLRHRLKHALRYSSDHTNFSTSDKRTTFNELPRELRYEVAVAMHKGAAKAIPFFTERDKVFIATIVPLLRSVYLEAGSVVYALGDYAEEIYFIASGRCVIMLESKHAMKKLQKGAYFGEIEVIEQIPRKFTVKSASDTDLLTMSKRVLSTIKSEFPFIYQEIVKIATLRDQLNSKHQDRFTRMLTVYELGQSQEGSMESPPIRGESLPVPVLKGSEITRSQTVTRAETGSGKVGEDLESRINDVQSDFEETNKVLLGICELLKIPFKLDISSEEG